MKPIFIIMFDRILIIKIEFYSKTSVYKFTCNVYIYIYTTSSQDISERDLKTSQQIDLQLDIFDFFTADKRKI